MHTGDWVALAILVLHAAIAITAAVYIAGNRKPSWPSSYHAEKRRLPVAIFAGIGILIHVEGIVGGRAREQHVKAEGPSGDDEGGGQQKFRPSRMFRNSRS